MKLNSHLRQKIRCSYFCGLSLFSIKRSTEYLPLPSTNNTIYTSRKRKAISFFPNGSLAWAMKPATLMLIISGIRNALEAKPRIRKAEQKNSAKTAKANDAGTPIPIGSANFNGSPEKNCINFGVPCESIKKPIQILAITITKSTERLFRIVENICFMA